MKKALFAACACAAAFGELGCSSASSSAEIPIAIAFEASVGTEPFACAAEYDGLGADGVRGAPADFRFYVHDVRLVDASGHEASVTLDEDGVWQDRGVALLDFEDGSGLCTNGSPETNRTLRGRVAEGTYVALRFKIGVPADLNHADPTSLQAPLDDTTLSWTWNFGHIYFSALAEVLAPERVSQTFHVGSMGCSGDAAGGEGIACARPNRAEIALEAFTVGTSRVRVDWAAVFASAPLAQKTDGCTTFGDRTICGCHVASPAALCEPRYAALGIDWATGEAKPAAQRVFTVE